jgi:hypothetical protein
MMIKGTKKRVSKKEKDFIEEYVATGNGVQSVLKSYDVGTYGGASAMANELLASPKIQALLAERIKDDLLAKKHVALLEKMDNQFPDQIDVQAVSKGLDMGYKLKGAYAPEKKDVNFVGIVADAKSLEIAQKYEDELKQGL